MEGMRGLAVLLVFCVHYQELIGHLLPVDTWQYASAHFVGQIGHTGVDLFFILSGYLIYGAAIRPALSLPKFWARRIKRLYPTFLVVFALYLLLSQLFPDRSKIPEEVLSKLIFFAVNLFLMAGLISVQPLITVTWSLSFEMFYYLTLPVLLLVTGMRNWKPSIRIAFLFALAVLYLSLFVAGPLLSPGLWSTSRMLMFLAGILLYERMHAPSPIGGSSRKEWGVVCLFLASMFGFYFVHELTHQASLTKEQLGLLALGKVLIIVLPFYLLNLYSFAYCGTLKKIFEYYPLRWLGNMSYSYYLIHGLVVQASAMLLAKFAPPSMYDGIVYWLAVPPVLVATLVASTVLFLAVERPFSLNAAAR